MLVPLDFWLEARGTLDQLKSLIWLAECEDPAYLTVFDLIYGWEWMHLTAAVARGSNNKIHLHQLLDKYQSLTDPGQKICFFTSNHDENSWNGTEYERYGQAALLFAALNMILPNGVPLIYSGQELPVMHRLQFFEKDEIPWINHTISLDSFYHLFLSLRKSNRNFKQPFIEVEINTMTMDERIFSIHFGNPGSQDVFGIFNLSHQGTDFILNGLKLNGKYKNVLTSETFIAQNEHKVCLSPYDFRVYENTEMNISVREPGKVS
jgi:alpha-amylase